LPNDRSTGRIVNVTAAYQSIFIKTHGEIMGAITTLANSDLVAGAQPDKTALTALFALIDTHTPPTKSRKF
jgi:hypothetical protein